MAWLGDTPTPGDPGSAAGVYNVRYEFNVRVPMRDGITLSADIYRPDAPGRFPVVLARTPYGKNTQRAWHYGNFFARHGYVFVWMDVRGRGDSEGEFVPYRNDAKDGYDAIEWLARQPWSTGDVATWGGSYLGRIQWLTALEKPPHLKAMIVHVTPSDPYVEWPTGTPGPMHVCWNRMTDGRVLQYVDKIDWMKVYEHLPLVTMDEAAGFVSRHWREDCAHPTLDEWWEPLRYQHRFHEIDLPVLHVSGWYDDEQIGTPLNFAGMVRHAPSERARRGQKLIMGPWGHRVNESRKLGEVDFGPEAVIDLDGYEVRWLDYWLKGIDNGIGDEPPVRLFIMGANRWRDEHEWPLARTRWTKFYLHSGGRANSRFGDGVLSTEPPATDEPPDVYLYDPARPVPFITDPLSSQIGGPDDYAAIETRGDVLVYSTPPLDRDVEVTGPVKLVLYASSSAVDTDFMAKLVEVHPNGFCQRLCDGMVRARFREGMHKEVLMEPGKVYRFEIDLWNTAQVFKRGHRIRLEIASSAFPKYDRNLNTGEPLATSTRMVVAENRVWHTPAWPSHLILPVIPE
ncbi:hydrolase CocE/NonD family protein [Thermaerobacter marianensis DSM 12885]|uniref:Hydrolase CocE/NonD family protein n=1 Tax=Thermaerobacter marianensis (strain ATCC 700841 / DSM 12885 / JCM 10246 / 7p75a) TaxID=644966 RepID=E6SI42_THEM7|nr:CocE/NonD family hydrolase [Thermaerobacter marianensis]ADU50820.1 hydrolase CocE/NonD family protein [Thermaerobacter marianensis DSM 12885]